MTLITLFPFICVILFFSFFAITDFSKGIVKKDTRALSFFIVITIFILFAGSRWTNRGFEHGLFDYESYRQNFEQIAKEINENPLAKSNTGFEIGYSLLVYLFKKFVSSNFNIWLLFYSGITTFFFVKSVVRNHLSRKFFLIIFVYITRLYFQYNFISMRQACAMALIWYSVPYIQEKKYWKFYFFCLLAISQHISAGIFIIMPLINNITLKKRAIILLPLVAFILGYSGIINKLLLIILNNFISIKKINDYIILSESKPINMLNFLEIAPFYYICIKYYNQLIVNKSKKFYLNMFLIYLIGICFFCKFFILTRFLSFFLYSYFFLLDFGLKKIRGNFTYFLVMSALLAYFIFYGIRLCYRNFSGTTYTFFLLQDIL